MQLPFPLELLVGLVRLRAEMLSELRLLSSKEALLAVDTKDVVALVGSVLQGDIGLVIELLKPLGSLGQRRRHLELVGGEHLHAREQSVFKPPTSGLLPQDTCFCLPFEVEVLGQFSGAPLTFGKNVVWSQKSQNMLKIFFMLKNVFSKPSHHSKKLMRCWQVHVESSCL